MKTRKFISISVEQGSEGGLWALDTEGFIWFRPWGCSEWSYRAVK